MRDLVRRYLHPREGWLSLALVMVMLLALAWSLQRAEWFEQLDFLVPIALYAAILGAVLGLTRVSVAIILPLSAAVGAWLVLWAIGGEFYTDLGAAGRLIALRGDALSWSRIVLDGGFAPQLSPYAVGLGVLMWVTGFIAAYTLYRHHRVLDAILLVGVALVANMAATFADLFGYIVLFSLAALLLWLRIALISREESWQLRRVTENVDVPAQIMRSGMTFIAGSVALAWVLTTVAVAAPLTSVWSNLDGLWADVRGQFEVIFGGLSGADSRIRGSGFGSSFAVRGEFISSDAEVMTVASQRGYYMRTVTYDIYTGHGWDSSAGSDRRIAANELIFPGYTPERPLEAEAFETETVTVVMQRGGGRNVFTPGYPTNALAPLIISQPGGLPLLGSLRLESSLEEGKGYQITAFIPKATEAMLSGAGIDYPAEIVATYTSTEGVTQATADEALRVVGAAGATDPYHQAKALANYLRTDSRFSYATLAELPSDPDRDLVDFFLFDANGQAGYCEYFASAMAVMARSLGIPSRVAVGYAPGERLEPGLYQVREANAHAWAEIYFPGYGWQSFEATKSLAPVSRLPGTGIVPPVPIPVGGVDDIIRGFREGEELGTVPTQSFVPVPGGFKAGDQPPVEPRTGNALLILGLGGLVVLVAAWRLLRGRRRFRFLAPGDRQWQRLAFAADRAGVAQRPSETVYEYAGWLQEQIPRRSAEIGQIADGKVWHSYSGRSITSEAIARIERAWGRLKVPLAWLALRSRIRSVLPERVRR